MGATRYIIRLAGAALAAAALAAQPEPASRAVGPSAAGKPAPLPPDLPPPLPPTSRNPVENLRQLLAKSPAERENAFAGKSEKLRDYLRQRMRELDALSPAERELHLRLLELRYYLLLLMKTDPTNRAEVLQSVPSADRRVIQERLQEWDAFSPERRKELLQNERALQCFPRFRVATGASSEAVNLDLSPEQRQKLEEDLARWRQFPPEKQERAYDRFLRFFGLSDVQQSKALRALPSSARLQTEKTVQAFAKLPADQRAKCLEAFHKFANMTPEQRNQFLENAARWEAMTPEERRAWRELVAQSPPSPPGMGLDMPMPPPLPSPAPVPSKAVALTNAPRP